MVCSASSFDVRVHGTVQEFGEVEWSGNVFCLSDKKENPQRGVNVPQCRYSR